MRCAADAGWSSQHGAATAERLDGASSQTRIQHIVLLVQESRTFNDLFVTTKIGKMRVGNGKHARTINVKLKETNLQDRSQLNTFYASYLRAYRNGNMDGFGQIENPQLGKEEGRAPYQYVNPAQVRTYRTLARDYGLADRVFQTQGSGDFTAHQDSLFRSPHANRGRASSSEP